jgi:hypothetical protein
MILFSVVVQKKSPEGLRNRFFNVHIIPLISNKWNNILQNIQKNIMKYS